MRRLVPYLLISLAWVAPLVGALPIADGSVVIAAPAGTDPRNFGVGLSGDGDLLAASGASSDGARVIHLYRASGDGWVHEAILPDAEHASRIAVNGERVAFTGPGSVSLYENGAEGWQKALGIPRGARNVALEGDHLAVSTGSEVDVYVRREIGTWSLEDTIRPPEGSQNTRSFGEGLDFGREQELIIGEPSAPNFQLPRIYYAVNGGSGDWVIHRSIASPDADRGNAFGSRVAYDGDHLVVGAYTTRHPAMPVGLPITGPWVDRAGSVFVFVNERVDGFREDGRIDGTGPLAGFGLALALDGDDVIVSDGLKAVTTFRYDHLTHRWQPADVILREGGEENFGLSLALVDGGLAVNVLPEDITAGASALTLGDPLVTARVQVYAR